MKNSEVPPDLLEFIRIRVWSGFYSADDIIESVTEAVEEEQYGEGELDLSEEQIYDLVDAEFQKKYLEEKKWPTETDCDRLTAAFKALSAKHIVSLENAGYTQSDGWSDIQEEVASLPPGTARGGCFYHEQDLERAVDGAGLYICYGAMSGTDEHGLIIAREIVSVLESFGFKPDWDGTIKRRVNLPIDWKRRYRE